MIDILQGEHNLFRRRLDIIFEVSNERFNDWYIIPHILFNHFTFFSRRKTQYSMRMQNSDEERFLRARPPMYKAPTNSVLECKTCGRSRISMAKEKTIKCYTTFERKMMSLKKIIRRFNISHEAVMGIGLDMTDPFSVVCFIVRPNGASFQHLQNIFIQ